MNHVVYRTGWPYLKVLFFCLMAGCGSRLQRVPDEKMLVVPESARSAVESARKELVMAKKALSDAQMQAKESELRLRIAKAAVRVAEARANQAAAELELANFQGETSLVVQAGRAQSQAQLDLRRAEMAAEVAISALTLAQLRLLEAQRKVDLLDARYEHERAKLALQYDSTLRPEERAASLDRYERASRNAETLLRTAEENRARAEREHAIAVDKLKVWESSAK